MKLVRRALLAIVLLVIVAGVILYFNLNRIVKNTVQSQASSSLNLATTLESANLSLFGGSLKLNQLQIASPQGFTAPRMLDVGDAGVAVSYGQLRNDPVHVSSITIDKPVLVIEQQNGVLNFKKAMEDLPPGDNAPSNSKPLKLIIDDLKLTNAQVIVKGLGATDIPVSLPSIELKDVGTDEGAKNGAAVKDVVMQVITAMAASATNSSALSAEFKQVLNANVGAALGHLGSEAQKRVAAAIPGQVGQSLAHLVSDPQSLAKDPGKSVQNLLGQSSTTQPSDPKNQAVNALEGLLGGKQKK